jgi:hypothetical protein
MKVRINLDRGSILPREAPPTVTVAARSIKSVGTCINGDRIHRKMADGGVIQLGVY